MKTFNKVIGPAIVAAVICTFGLTGITKSATTIDLGIAKSFAILAGSTVTNTGPSVITGDLGLSPGTSVTGFPPGTLNGIQHVANTTTVQAKIDLTTAYGNAAGQTPVTTIPTELGGTTKTAGIYDSSAGTFGITGTLTLDAQGDPSAVFIFKTASTLITAGSSVVSLINGAQPCNVFWQVGSSAILGTNSTFKGNILALASATLTTGANVEGRVLARNGAVTLDANTVTAAACSTNTNTNAPVNTSANTNTPPNINTNIPVNTNTNTPVDTNSAPPEPSKPVPTIHSTTHPDQNAWYAANTLKATWSGGPRVIGYNALFNQMADSVPDEHDSSSTTTMSRSGLDDGIWYVHIRAQYNAGWSATTHFAFHIDTHAPAPFAVVIADRKVTDRTATVSFVTKDEASGIAEYTLKTNKDAFQNATSPVQLANLPPGSSMVTVRAFDRAENMTEATAILTVDVPAAPIVTLVTPPRKLIGVRGNISTIIAGEPLLLRGIARLADRIKIIVRSQPSVFEFPVESISDDSPIEPLPAGFGAWKVEIKPDLDVGTHQIQVTTIRLDGAESDPAPIIHFQVINKVVKVGGVFISYSSLRGIVGSIAAIILCFILLYLVRYRRHSPIRKFF
ncbi:MAG: ice-binding family protein [bacterium]